MSNVYFKVIIDEIPRLLGLLDKNPISPTFGSFDRNYWHYNISDFSCARFQEATLTLALLYLLNYDNNPYYNSEDILKFINGGVNFWCKIQRKNGSFDEWYPYEGSFVATAFSTCAISEVLLLLKEKIANFDNSLRCIKKAVDFLSKNVDYTACNQEAGAILAIYNCYLLTSESKYRDLAYKRLNDLSKLQKEEGWFPEYGGPDIGYLSLTIDYLAKVYEKSNWDLAKEMLTKAIDFLYYFSHPDGSFGGEYGSRNTKYIIPSGIEFIAPWNRKAGYIAFNLRRALFEKKTIGPYNLDDRYLAYIGYTYLQASLYFREDLEVEERGHVDKYFEESGIWVFSNSSFYLVSNFKKGGVLKVNFKNGSSFKDSGIILKTKNKIYTSSWLNSSEEKIIKDGGFKVSREMKLISFYKMSIIKGISLRVFQLLLGRFEFINKLVKKFLRGILITKQKSSGIRFFRTIKVVNEKIEMEDLILSSENINKVFCGVENSYIFIPSSRYFEIGDLNKYFHEIEVGSKKVIIRRVFDEEGNEEFDYKSD